MQMAMKDGSDDLLSRTKLLSLELLQVFYYQYFADINIMSMVSCLCIFCSITIHVFVFQILSSLTYVLGICRGALKV
jgi:hypothetical protein